MMQKKQTMVTMGFIIQRVLQFLIWIVPLREVPPPKRLGEREGTWGVDQLVSFPSTKSRKTRKNTEIAINFGGIASREYD